MRPGALPWLVGLVLGSGWVSMVSAADDAGEDLVLQLSGAAKDHVLVAVTPAAAPAQSH